MGHKVNPLAFRIGYIKTWKTTGYYNKQEYGKKVASDVQLRIFIQKFLTGIPIGNIFINHTNSETAITIYTSKTALVLGKNDENLVKMEEEIKKNFPGKYTIDVKEVKKPELSSSLVAESIARQIEKKLPYRRVIKNAIAKTMEKGGLGIKIIL